MKIVDITGKRYAKLTVIDRAPDYVHNGRNQVRWNCQCQCGNHVVVSKGNLDRGQQSCGCVWQDKNNLSGQRFGRWTVQNICKRQPHGRHQRTRLGWLCKCDCGNTKMVSGNSLRMGKSKSCGCLHREMAAKVHFKGGRIERSGGYVYILDVPHPNANHHGYVSEHALVMSKFLGRGLTTDELVHHKNGIKNDNRIENLELWSKGHPAGQRVEDLIVWAKAILQKYEIKNDYDGLLDKIVAEEKAEVQK